jgi:hypothetical protein
MKLYLFVLALAPWAYPASSELPARSGSATCSQELRQMTEREMATKLIGQHIEYGPLAKCSGGRVVVTMHWLLLRPDNTAYFRGDRAGREGRYYFAGNQFCVAFPKLRLWTGNRTVKVPGEDVFCHDAFVDDQETWYLRGGLFDDPDDIDALAAIKLEPGN